MCVCVLQFTTTYVTAVATIPRPEENPVRQKYTGNLPNGHPSTVDTHNITDNSESPDRPSFHFNT